MCVCVSSVAALVSSPVWKRVTSGAAVLLGVQALTLAQDIQSVAGVAYVLLIHACRSVCAYGFNHRKDTQHTANSLGFGHTHVCLEQQLQRTCRNNHQACATSTASRHPDPDIPIPTQLAPPINMCPRGCSTSLLQRSCVPACHPATASQTRSGPQQPESLPTERCRAQLAGGCLAFRPDGSSPHRQRASQRPRPIATI